MAIWTKNQKFIDYIERTLLFKDFGEWKKIFDYSVKDFQKIDEKIILLLLQVDCHVYLNDMKAPKRYQELNDILKDYDYQNEYLNDYINAYNEWVIKYNRESAFQKFQLIVQKYNDISALKRGQLIAFLMGQNKKQLEIAQKFNPDQCYFKGKYYYAMLSFAYGEIFMYKEAAEAIEKGLKIEVNDPWLHHAQMHNLFFTESNITKCIKISENFVGYWQGLNAFLRSHNFWHLSLFYLENQEIDKVIQIFESQLWNFKDQLYLENLVNAIQLLWKLEIHNKIKFDQKINDFVNRSFSMLYDSFEEEVYGNIGYLMYNLLILKVLKTQKADKYETQKQIIWNFCEQNEMKEIIPLLEFLYEEKYENENQIFNGLAQAEKLLGSEEQLLIFQEACVPILIQKQEIYNAEKQTSKLLSVRSSPIYQKWQQIVLKQQ
ncbi:hypothetical protein PPERSA_09371 [Pseudocohnilembus persalinus]|uniref:Tetratricopeptide repeat protein 38 n=1 Tax=Pseudocohnilembus persalinus TaxID=266149 RepID=A0A0V0QKU7_PSEPJ|nr:hypothetical protein PPERSA_09371 [Pseudocohnilembus persalinus]|eukprot:KRX02953.1 hypothetical protein PPERSA_09371 [Pseudocohnilembus persalinus]